MTNNAFTLLSQQPTAVRELSEDDRSHIVISAVVSDGIETVISRYGDMVWNLWPFFKQSNVSEAKKRINWEGVPAGFINTVKAIAYRYWMVGAPGRGRPKAVTVTRLINYLTPFLRWLLEVGIQQLSEVRPLHISSFKESDQCLKKTPAHRALEFGAIQLLFSLNEPGGDALRFDPWQGSSAKHAAGMTGHRGPPEAKTPLIPQDVLSKLFCFAEGVLTSTPSIRTKRSHSTRNACIFLLAIVTGMRQEEIVGVRVGAHRSEVKDGITYHWVATVENKITSGEAVEYLMPEIGVQVLQVMEAWSAPLRACLRNEVVSLSSAPRNESNADRKRRLQRLARATADQDRLFLGIGHGNISAISGDSVRRALRSLAKCAGVDWTLAPHQLRRTFVSECVHHELGDLVYLKKHLKHRSISMTELYAMNEKQDESLFNELLEAHLEAKTDLITHLLNPQTALAGGAAAGVLKVRSQFNTVVSRRELAEDTAEVVNIRGTGHAWCLSQFQGCGGQGLWERTRCGPCDDGLIEQSHIPVWQGIYWQQLELQSLGDSLGPGAARRIERDLARAADTLSKLGVSLTSEVPHG